MSVVQFSLNGNSVSVSVADPNTTLLEWLREDKGLTGTKEGCNEGDCGACTVILSELLHGEWVHRPVNACILFLPQVNGKSVLTVEGVSGPDGQLHPIQKAMIDFHGSQCGFCTPGFVTAMVSAHLTGNADVDSAVAGNLCRCTGYAPIARAAESVAEIPVPEFLMSRFCDNPDSSKRVRSEHFFIPSSVEELAEWYLGHPDSTLVAGATDVGLWVTKQLRALAPVCFIGNVPELRHIQIHAETAEIGAAVKLEELLDAVSETYPSFGELIRRFGSVQVRSSATVGGNIANGSPIGDLAPALIALGSQLRLRMGAARRTIELEDFFIDYGVQDREPGEFVDSIVMPMNCDNLRCYKISKRFDQDISAICGCFNFTLEGSRIADARIAFGGMAAIPQRAKSTERALVGQPWNENTISMAAHCLGEDFAPITDFRASREYRLLVAQNLLVKYFFEITHPEQPSNAYLHRASVQ